MRFARACILSLFAAAMVAAATAGAADRGVTVRLKDDAGNATPVRLYGASHALVIGIDAYRGGWPRLSNAVADARAIADELERHGFQVDLLTDPDSATLDKTLKEFFIVKGDDPDARLFVWFAGHGHTLHGEGFLVPADAPRPERGTGFRLKAIPMRDFGTYVRLARSKHVLAVFDSCFAGTVFDTQRALPPPAITRATTLPVREFITSGDADQSVSDDGMFRELFLRALRGEEAADANGDGYVTGSEIGLYLSDRVTNLTRQRQTPRYGKLRDKDFDRGDFVFTLHGAGPLATPSATGTDTEVVFWQSIRDSNDPTLLQAYLDRYPDGLFAPIALARLAPAPQAFEPGTYTVLKNANVRDEPTRRAKRVGTLPTGTVVAATEAANGEAGTWYRIRSTVPLANGWVWGRLMARNADAAPSVETGFPLDRIGREVTVVEPLTVLTRPGPRAPQATTLHPGDRITVVGRVRGTPFHLIARNGAAIGYLQGRVSGPDRPPPIARAPADGRAPPPPPRPPGGRPPRR